MVFCTSLGGCFKRAAPVFCAPMSLLPVSQCSGSSLTSGTCMQKCESSKSKFPTFFSKKNQMSHSLANSWFVPWIPRCFVASCEPPVYHGRSSLSSLDIRQAGKKMWTKMKQKHCRETKTDGLINGQWQESTCTNLMRCRRLLCTRHTAIALFDRPKHHFRFFDFFFFFFVFVFFGLDLDLDLVFFFGLTVFLVLDSLFPLDFASFPLSFPFLSVFLSFFSPFFSFLSTKAK